MNDTPEATSPLPPKPQRETRKDPIFPPQYGVICSPEARVRLRDPAVFVNVASRLLSLQLYSDRLWERILLLRSPSPALRQPQSKPREPGLWGAMLVEMTRHHKLSKKPRRPLSRAATRSATPSKNANSGHKSHAVIVRHQVATAVRY